MGVTLPPGADAGLEAQAIDADEPESGESGDPLEARTAIVVAGAPPAPPTDLAAPVDEASASEPAGSGESAGPAGPGDQAAPVERRPLRADDAWSEAARRAFEAQVERLLSLDEAIRDPSAVDELRRYRVACRRLRAALRVFDDAVPGHGAATLRRTLATVARDVGAVRDLDVRLTDLERWAGGRDGGPEAVGPLANAWREERASAHADLVRELQSGSHERLLERLRALVAEPGADGDPDHPAVAIEPRADRVRDHAGPSIWLAYARLQGFGPEVHAATASELHAIRVEGKRLRYTLEFLGDVLGRDGKLLVARLVALQDRLGAANDAVTTGKAVASYLADSADQLSDRQRRAIVAYQVASLNRLARIRRSVPVSWRLVTSPAFARRLAGSVASITAAGRPSQPEARSG